MKNIAGQDFGRYHIIEPLGQGGMASVYKAYDTSLERHVAVKIIRTDLGDGPDKAFLLRFQREAKALAQLDHPYILKVLDYGEQDGVPYLVMPFVPGGTLKQKMGHPMPYHEAAGLLAPIARALEYAHQQKIIHRDVKPANILVDQVGTPLLSDFGIAKMLTAGETQLTETGVGIGTPDYMAPEQWLGKADPHTDIYSLGVIFYEMLTGRRPFTADTPAAVLLKHLNDPLPRPQTFIPDLPEAIEQVLYKALAKEPDSRFRTMGEFALALEKIAHSEQTSLETVMQGFDTVVEPVRTSSRTESAQKKAPASRPTSKVDFGKFGLIAIVAVLVMGFFCILVGGGIWTALSNRTNQQNTPVATEPESTPGISSTSVPQGAVTFDPPSQGENPTPIQSIKGYPDDVPLLQDNNGDLSTTKGQGMTMYTFTTKLPFQEVSDFYNAGMIENGWELSTETSQANTYIWYYMKGESRMIMVSVNEENDSRRVTVMVVDQP